MWVPPLHVPSLFKLLLRLFLVLTEVKGTFDRCRAPEATLSSSLFWDTCDLNCPFPAVCVCVYDPVTGSGKKQHPVVVDVALQIHSCFLLNFTRHNCNRVVIVRL